MIRSSLVTCLLGCVASGCIVYPHRAEIGDERSLDLAGVDQVEVETRNGAVEVTCRDAAGSSLLESRRHARGMTEEEARTYAESIRVVAERDPARPAVLRIAAEIPDGMDGRSPGCHFRLEMPRGADVLVHTRNGDVTLEGVRGHVDANTSNGKIQVDDVVGSVRGKTSNGAVQLESVRGDVEVETSNGEVKISRIEAGSISVASSNGGIEAESVSGAASLETSNGSIAYRAARLPRLADVNVATSNGSVTLEVPSDVQARVSLKTSNGRIHRDFGTASVSGLDADKNDLEADLNGGGGQIRARSSNGDITFRASGARAGRSSPTRTSALPASFHPAEH
jgi:hypothetical protein